MRTWGNLVLTMAVSVGVAGSGWASVIGDVWPPQSCQVSGSTNPVTVTLIGGAVQGLSVSVDQITVAGDVVQIDLLAELGMGIPEAEPWRAVATLPALVPGTYAVEVAMQFGGTSLGPVNMCSVTVDPFALRASDPVANGTLCKVANNCVWLTFDQDIALGDGAALSIVPICGANELGGQFTYLVDGAVLRARENGGVLVNQTWYRLMAGPGLTAAPFQVDLCTLVGDADGNGCVMALDLGRTWAFNGASTPPKPVCD